MKFRMKIYRVENEILVAVCDSNLIGKKFQDEGIRIEINENFYGEDEVEEEEVKKALEEATIANISGERAVRLAIRIGIVDENNVLKIKECWHAQMVTM
ncbi:MAG TPA: DUF424 family protein [Archaeoglobaceae archaeon]|nr:DUF424 family protein [Archaeoglobaceae archaeon]